MFLIGTGAIIGIISAILVLLIVIWSISVYNKLKGYNEKVNEAESGIDVALEKRFDQLTKLIEVTKSYSKYEAETLLKVIEARKGYNPESSVVEKSIAADEIASEVSKAINVVVEKYPELKANDVYVNLQVNITDTEDHLQAARRLYNSNVQSLNRTIIIFPNSIIASIAHIGQREYFKTEDKKREDVKIDL